MKKQVINKFGEHYLLGADADGTKYWLEKESWDCGWYWGLGYVHTFTNNSNPERSRDINSHSHFDSMFFKKNINGYDAFRQLLVDTPLSDEELWTLVELMRTAYTLKESAEVFGRGGSHYTTNPCADVIKTPGMVMKINDEMIPSIMEEVRKILVP